MQRNYKKGANRNQSELFPRQLDDYISPTNPVRAIDAYVNSLNLSGFEFEHTEFFMGSGQPAYDPADLLKLYLYGYNNHTHSSRRLERETQRNLEVIWLLGSLHPVIKRLLTFVKITQKH